MKHFLGIADDEFIRGKVPMTKQEIRILTMAKARIGAEDIVYDIGAGTGSLSIEAALQAENGHVYAIERKAEGIALIQQNAEKFGVRNLTVVQHEAPEGMDELPACNVVLIGGSGSHLEEILAAVDRKLVQGGRILLNCITVQTLASCIAYMRRNERYSYEAIQVQVNRLRQVGPYDMAEAINPIYIVVCEKG